MSYTFDSSSLMYLGKTNLLEKIKFISNKNFMPKKVYEEVILKGIERNEPEIAYIKALIEKGLFIIQEGKNLLDNFPLLSEADREVIVIAKETNSTAIIDETYAKRIAKSLNVQVHGSIYIIIKLLKKRVITKIESKNYIVQMIELGFYLSTKKYKEVLEIIEKLK